MLDGDAPRDTLQSEEIFRSFAEGDEPPVPACSSAHTVSYVAGLILLSRVCSCVHAIVQTAGQNLSLFYIRPQ